MQKEIDGNISSKERTRLQEFLQKDDKTKYAYQTQIQTSRLLNSISPVDPPPNLKKRIMNSIDLDRYHIKENKRGFQFSFIKKQIPKFVFAFVLGIIVGIILPTSFLITSTSTNPKNIIGAIGLQKKGHSKMLERLAIDLPTVKGKITLNELNGLIPCEIDLESRVETELLLKFDSDIIQFLGYTPYSGTGIVLRNEEHEIHSTHTAGVHYEIFLTKKSKTATQLNVTLLQSGSIQYDREIKIQKTE